ncbi:MAG: YbhN family protein [Candidatus Coproplasma sp.]
MSEDEELKLDNTPCDEGQNNSAEVQPEAEAVITEAEQTAENAAAPVAAEQTAENAAAPVAAEQTAENVTAPVAAEQNAENVTAPVAADAAQTQPVQAAKPKSKLSKIILNVVFVILIGLGIYSLFGIVNEIKPGEGATFGEVFSNVSPWFAVLFVAVILAIMFLDCTKFCIIDKTVTGSYRFSSSIKTSFLGKYYDAVTPFSTGGQPMQIYYLNSKGISGGNSTAIVLIRYFSSIFTWASLGAGLMIAGTAKHVLDGTTGKTLLMVTGWIGVAINLLLPIFIASFLIFPKIMNKLTGGVVRLGKKIKIVKDEERALKKATKVVYDFKHSFKVMATSPFNLVMLILVSYAEAFLTFSVPYFVMKAFNCGVEGQLITIMSLNAFATFGVSFIPTPGNSGVMEGMAALAFSSFAGNTLAWSVLVWRLAVYYIYIIVGLGITIRDIIKKNIVNRRKEKEQRKNC